LTEPSLYVVRQTPVRVLVVSIAGLAAFSAFSAFVVGGGTPTLFIVVAISIIVAQVRAASVRLRVNADGVRIGRGIGYAYGDRRALSATVPWTSVDEVLVIASGVGAEQVALRLRSDAPLPWGVSGVIRDPNAPDPVPPELRTELPPGSLDRRALAAAVAAYGGGTVKVVEQTV